MLLFLVCLVLTAVAAGELEETGLYHNYNTEYAPTYHNYEPRDYHFEYGVSDPHTGDHKSQWETKDKAGVVRGGYSLLEPDGTTRIVEYIADDHGFRAVVKKLGTSIHPEHVEVHGHTSHEHQQQELPHLSSPIVVADDIEPLTEAPIYQSYDGHVDNYANVLSAAVKHLEPISYGKAIEIPHTEELHGYQHIPQQNYYPQQEVFSPKAQGVYFDAPRHQESIGSFGPNVLIPKAEGIYPQAPIKAPVILPEQHQQYILEQPQYKVAPVYTQNLEQRVLEQPRYEQSQYKVSPVYAQNLEQRILEQPKIALTGYEQPQYKVEPVYQHSLQQRVPLAYSQGPQQIYGGAGHQQEIYQEPINIQHPHGESSGQYHGITNNPEDDSAYTQYGGHRQQELNNDYEGEYTQGVPKYLSVPSKRQAKALPYNFVVKHPILH